MRDANLNSIKATKEAEEKKKQREEENLKLQLEEQKRLEEIGTVFLQNDLFKEMIENEVVEKQDQGEIKKTELNLNGKKYPLESDLQISKKKTGRQKETYLENSLPLSVYEMRIDKLVSRLGLNENPNSKIDNL